MQQIGFWSSRWEAGQLGFHRTDTNDLLLRHAAQLGEGRHVLVPLCGKSLDMVWLAEQGHRVVGVEWVELAVQQFFEALGVQPEREQTPAGPLYRHGPFTLLAGNLFDATAEIIGPVDAVWDRAALVALPPEYRQRYAPHLVSLLPAGGRMLLVTIDYDQARVSGPPFSVPLAQVRALYGADCDIEELDHSPTEAIPPRFSQAGLESVDRYCALITRRDS